MGRQVLQEAPECLKTTHESKHWVQSMNSTASWGCWLALVAGVEACRWVEEVQQDLFDLGAIIARGKLEWKGEEKSAQLERWTEELNAALPPLEEFVLPGGGVGGGAMPCGACGLPTCRTADCRIGRFAGSGAGLFEPIVGPVVCSGRRTLAREKGQPEKPWRGVSLPGK